jgi:hypothetical protein
MLLILPMLGLLGGSKLTASNGLIRSLENSRHLKNAQDKVIHLNHIDIRFLYVILPD